MQDAIAVHILARIEAINPLTPAPEPEPAPEAEGEISAESGGYAAQSQAKFFGA